MDEATMLTGVVLLGLVLKISGFVVRDELVLRCLVGTGLLCDATFYALRSEPILQSVLISTGLATINFVLISFIIFERTTLRMSAHDKMLFGHFNTLTPGQFRRVHQLMDRQSEEAGARLTYEGQPVEDLMLVFSDRIVIAKDGEAFPITGPAFVGEIAFLTDNPSSADVTLPDGGTVLRMDVAALKAQMARSRSLNNAMIALLGKEMARKVADSVPMARASWTRLIDGRDASVGQRDSADISASRG